MKFIKKNQKVCPMFVHKSITSNDILDYSNRNDGFYVAQTTRTVNEDPYPDVSKRPFRLEDNQLLDENDGINDLIDIDPCYVSIIIATSESVPQNATYNRGSYSEDGYQPGSQWEKGNVYVILVKNEKWFEAGENPRFDLKFDNGSELRVYLPSYCSMESDEDFLAFWIAEDGSTYNTNPLGEGGYQLSEVFQFDSPYAIRHSGLNPAKSALVGLRAVTGNPNAKSIAVDNGSLDFFNYGTTSTDLEDDCPSESECANDPDYLVDKSLDIGYHYLIAKEAPAQDHYGLYHPIEKISEQNFTSWKNDRTYNNINPFVDHQHHLGIESVEEPGTIDEKSVSVYRSKLTEYFEPIEKHDETEYITEFFMYNKFRDNAGYGVKFGEIDLFETYWIEDEYNTYVYSPYTNAIAITSAHKVDQYNIDEYDEVPDGEGEIYAVCSLNWYTMVGNQYTVWEPIPVPHKSWLYIYRYDPELVGNKKWTKIAYLEYNGPGLDSAPEHIIYDVAICARNNHLWVAWTDNKYYDPNNGPTIRCAYISHPKERPNQYYPVYAIDDQNDAIQIVDLTLLGDGTGYLYLGGIPQTDMSWDDTINFMGQNNVFRGRPRITWHDIDEYSSEPYLNAAQIDLDEYTYKPSGLVFGTNKTIDSGSSYSFSSPSITANDYSLDIGFTEADRVAFSSFKNPDFTLSRYSRCDANDNWDTPESIPGPASFSSSTLADTSYRGFGTDRYLFYANSNVMTNTEVLEECEPEASRINTNSTNMTDIFTCYSDGNYTVKIRQIDP